MALSVKPLVRRSALKSSASTRVTSPRTFTALHQALLDHHLLVIRNQPTADADLVELGKSFGPIVKARLVSPLTGATTSW